MRKCRPMMRPRLGQPDYLCPGLEPTTKKRWWLLLIRLKGDNKDKSEEKFTKTRMKGFLILSHDLFAFPS